MKKKRNQKKFVSLRHAAQMWGMSEAALRRRVKCGLIEAVNAPWSRSQHAGLLIDVATLDALRAARWCSQNEAPARFAPEGVTP